MAWYVINYRNAFIKTITSVGFPMVTGFPKWQLWLAEFRGIHIVFKISPNIVAIA